jgi:hypothetical protein
MRYSWKKAEMKKVTPVAISFDFVPLMMGM